MKSSIEDQTIGAPVARETVRTVKPIASPDRPKWNGTHNGLTWRDMPCQSEDGSTFKKILFALYRLGATTIEEDFFIERKRTKEGAQ